MQNWYGGLALGAGLLALSCVDGDGTTRSTASSTLVAVRPDAFLGEVPCRDLPDAMRVYSATLIDLTVDLDGQGGAAPDLIIPSSGPISCHQPVAFELVAVGHRYAAEIQGYDRTDLRPLAPGSPILVDPQTEEHVLPRWVTSCGMRPGESVVAVRNQTRFVQTCAPLVDAGPQ
jgi:hypothetical protein